MIKKLLCITIGGGDSDGLESRYMGSISEQAESPMAVVKRVQGRQRKATCTDLRVRYGKTSRGMWSAIVCLTGTGYGTKTRTNLSQPAHNSRFSR